jgi:hypothetical protein
VLEWLQLVDSQKVVFWTAFEASVVANSAKTSQISGYSKPDGGYINSKVGREQR